MRFYFIILRPLPNASLCFRCGPALSRCHKPCNFESGDRWAMKPRDLEKILFLGNSDILVKFRWIIFTKLLQFWWLKFVLAYDALNANYKTFKQNYKRHTHKVLKFNDDYLIVHCILTGRRARPDPGEDLLRHCMQWQRSGISQRTGKTINFILSTFKLNSYFFDRPQMFQFYENIYKIVLFSDIIYVITFKTHYHTRTILKWCVLFVKRNKNFHLHLLLLCEEKLKLSLTFFTIENQ